MNVIDHVQDGARSPHLRVPGAIASSLGATPTLPDHGAGMMLKLLSNGGACEPARSRFSIG